MRTVKKVRQKTGKERKFERIAWLTYQKYRRKSLTHPPTQNPKGHAYFIVGLVWGLSSAVA